MKCIERDRSVEYYYYEDSEKRMKEKKYIKQQLVIYTDEAG
jgi:hypothetical protein